MTPDLIALKRATAETIKGVGGLEAAAPYCRVGKSQLSDNQSISKPECFMAVDVLAALEPLARERSGWPHVTRYLCEANGGTFVELPQEAATSGDLLSALSDLHKEFAEATGAVCTAVADGRVDAQDRVEVSAQLNDVIRVAAQMLALVKSMGDC